MTKTLGKSALALAAIIASNFLPIPEENRPKLVADLEADPFVNHALNVIMCNMFHQYRALLAPITAAILKSKHCDFRQGYQTIIPQQNGVGGGADYSTSGVADASSGDTSVTDNNESDKK